MRLEGRRSVRLRPGKRGAGGVPRGGRGVRCRAGRLQRYRGPAAAGIPVTARGMARSFAVVTAHQAGDSAATDLASARRRGYDRRADGPIGGCRSSPPTSSRPAVVLGHPAACIQSATAPEQRVTIATLSTDRGGRRARDGLEAPVVTVIGEVARIGATALTRWSPRACR